MGYGVVLTDERCRSGDHPDVYTMDRRGTVGGRRAGFGGLGEVPV